MEWSAWGSRATLLWAFFLSSNTSLLWLLGSVHLPFTNPQVSNAGKWCAIYSLLTQWLEHWSETQEPRDILYIRSVHTAVSVAVFYSRERDMGHRRIIDNPRPLISSHSNDYFHLNSLFPYETRWNVSLHDLIRILVHVGDIFL